MESVETEFAFILSRRTYEIRNSIAAVYAGLPLLVPARFPRPTSLGNDRTEKAPEKTTIPTISNGGTSMPSRGPAIASIMAESHATSPATLSRVPARSFGWFASDGEYEVCISFTLLQILFA